MKITVNDTNCTARIEGLNLGTILEVRGNDEKMNPSGYVYLDGQQICEGFELQGLRCFMILASLFPIRQTPVVRRVAGKPSVGEKRLTHSPRRTARELGVTGARIRQLAAGGS
jgi:hypothetical protein